MLGGKHLIEVEDGAILALDQAAHFAWAEGLCVVSNDRRLLVVYPDQQFAVSRTDADRLLAAGAVHAVGDRIFERPDLAAEIFSWDIKPELAFIESQLLEHKGDLGIEYGCGWGRLLLPLVERGYVIDGLDVSETTVRWLQGQRGADGKSRLIVGDMASLAFPENYKFALSGSNTLRYLASLPRLKRHLHMAAVSVRPGGKYVAQVDSWPECVEGGELEGASSSWSVSCGGRACEVTWRRMRQDSRNNLDLEEVCVRTQDEVLIVEHQTQLSLSIEAWCAAFEERDEWRIVGVYNDAGKQLERVGKTFASAEGYVRGNYWFIASRSEVESAAISTG